ncbi:hypothetical protein AGR4C_Lc120099 [Agrobacterium tumefaciens str. Kerr 14]|uniref:Uncharacterized protein n=1 Tax=Agrobacterium tumefaciens str. Kerr 14 TaxID=1183424 RepID=A0A1S7R824_AGRTU|nr:hypothetical protein AGR4C_Lc120099 [Agrobacterium tumefaciens str. Kerr 14]
MAGAHHEADLFRIEMLKGKARHFLRRGQTADNKIEIADPQLFQQHGVFTRDDLHRAAGFLRQKPGHRLRHDSHRNRRQSADPHRRTGARRLLRNGINRLPQRRHCRTGMAQEDLAITADADAAPLPVEQRDTENIFQLTDRLRHRRLADMQDFRSADDAFLPRHLNESLQVSELDTLIDHRSYNPQVMIFIDNVILLNRNTLAISLAGGAHHAFSALRRDRDPLSRQGIGHRQAGHRLHQFARHRFPHLGCGDRSAR